MAMLEEQGLVEPDDGPDIPEAAVHVWSWFCEIHNGRQGGGFGPSPLSWEGIAAWARLTGRSPAPWEIDAIKALDAAWLASVAQKD